MIRRACVLVTVIVFACATLAGTGEGAFARALRKKHPRTPAATPAGETAEATDTSGPGKRKGKGKGKGKGTGKARGSGKASGKKAKVAKPRKSRPARRAEELIASPSELVPRRLLIVGFAGRGALMIRSTALAALRNIPSLRIAPLRPSDAMRIGTMYSAEKSVALARQLNLTAVLYGEVTQSPRNVRVSLLLANGEDGQTVGTFAFEGRSLAAVRAQVRAQVWSKLEPLIDEAASPGPPGTPSDGLAETPSVAAPEEPSPPPRVPVTPVTPDTRGKVPPVPRAIAEAEPPVPRRPEEGEPQAGDETGEEAAPAPPVQPVPTVRRRPGSGPAVPDEAIAGGTERPAPSRRPCALAEIEPAGGVMLRRFNYRDEQRGALRGYALYRAAAGGVEGTLYPFSNEACGLKARIGMRLAYERMVPVISRLADRQLSTQASAYQAELVWRLGRGAFTLQPAIGYFARQYTVEEGVVPNAEYQAVGASLDAGLRLGFVTIELGAGGRRLLGAGVLQNADWFPGLSSFAMSGRGRLGVAVNDWVDILAGGTVEYYSFDFKIDPGAPYPNGVASGAYDLYLQGQLSVRFRLGLARKAPTAN